MTTRLSSLQYPLLKIFCETGAGMSIDDAQHYDQRPFRSMLIRGWVKYSPRTGFAVIEHGKEAYHEFLSRDILRRNPALPLTAYFDPAAYGLSAPRPKKAVAKESAA